MLARRFTIVCLLVTLFGMFFSIAVANSGRHSPSGGMHSCVVGSKILCGLNQNRR